VLGWVTTEGRRDIGALALRKLGNGCIFNNCLAAGGNTGFLGDIIEPAPRLGVVRVDHQHIFEADLLLFRLGDNAAQPHPCLLVMRVALDHLAQYRTGGLLVSPAGRFLSLTEQALRLTTLDCRCSYHC
jgi:hypothetical protein